MSTLWLSLCLVLFAHNLIELMSDRHQLSYKIVEEDDVLFDKDYDLNYLVCIPFYFIKRLNSLTYEPATQNVSVRSFLNYSIASIEHKLKVTGWFRLNESFIFNGHVCFPTTKSQLEKRDEKGMPEDCLRRCPERACFWEVMISLKIDYFYYLDFLQEEGKEKVDLQLNTYVAFYSMDDFYLQLFGLLTLFTGTCVLKLLHPLLSLALRATARKIESLLRNEKLLRIFRFAVRNLKYVPILLCLVFLLVQSLAMVNEFRFHSSHPNRTSSLNFSSEPFSIVICIPILLYEKNSSASRKFSFHLIERDLKNVVSKFIDDIKIYSGNKRIEPKPHISNEVLLKSSQFRGSLWFFICFRLNFDVEEKLRKIPLTHFKIRFTSFFREVFLIERHQNFTSDLVNFRGLFNPQKVTKIRSKSSVKSNCRDYSEEEGCDSRRNCLDRCLSTRYIEKHGSIPTNTVVSSRYLNSTMLTKMIELNKKQDPVIEEKCSALFNQIDCREVRFEESPDSISSEVNWRYIFIRLSYLNIVEREMEYDPLKTLLDIIGLETVLFGSNALGLLTTVVDHLFFRRTLRLKWRRAYRVFLLLLASFGFLAHNVLVFQTRTAGERVLRET